MQPEKKDESVKAGLEIAAHTRPETEKDPDDLVHQRADELPDESKERDADELVHEHPASTVENELDEKDPDELVHERGNEGP